MQFADAGALPQVHARAAFRRVVTVRIPPHIGEFGVDRATTLTAHVTRRYPTAMRFPALLLTLSILLAPRAAPAFSVLAHQGIVDATWNDTLVPEIRRRFPHASDDELRKARAF